MSAWADAVAAGRCYSCGGAGERGLCEPCRQKVREAKRRLKAHRIAAANAPCPSPDAICRACGRGPVHARGYCQSCYSTHYRRRYTASLCGDRDRAATLDEVARVLGVSRERVRQIEARALRRFHAAWVAEHGRGF